MGFTKHVVGIVAGLGLWLCAGTAEAQVHLVWPEVGFGAGTFATGNGQGAAIQLDFGVGAEGNGYPWTKGFIARFDLLAIDDGSGNFAKARFDVAPLLTLSSTYDTAAPFFRVGAGPLLTFSDTATSLGAHGEVAIGLKSIVDLYLDGKASADVDGLEVGATVGLRLNAYVFDWFYHGSGWYWY
jgi:hypothetical protein